MQNTNEKKLRAYQAAGVGRLIELVNCRGAAILADEPGLGKTIQVAEFINRTRPDFVLIVCPASLRLNWDRELKTWTAPEWYCSFPLLEIVSYEEAVRGRLRAESYDLIVFDEAHYLKNPSAKRTKACLALKGKARLFLTGTPVVNRPMDIYPILSAIGVKMNKTEFGKRYCAGHLVQIGWHPRKFAWDFSGASHIEELNAALRENCMVRRTKAEVLTELPAKSRQVIELDLPGWEPASLRDAVTAMFDGLESAAANLRELKRIAFEELSKARLETARRKLPAVAAFVRDLLEEENKVVVFAYHREIISELIELLSVRCVYLFGGMSDRLMDDAVRAFQSGDARVFVGQITAAGTGLTLTASHTVVFAELDWVPGNITQAEDRCHRIGQTEPVRVFHLAASGSVDARMIHALVDKQNIIEGVVK